MCCQGPITTGFSLALGALLVRHSKYAIGLHLNLLQTSEVEQYKCWSVVQGVLSCVCILTDYREAFEFAHHVCLLPQWPGRKQKVAATIIGMITTGIGIPAFAVWYQQRKLKG